MNLAHLHPPPQCFSLKLSSVYTKIPLVSLTRTMSTFTFSASSRPIIPARDRVIDFGKYKGKMLGTLPSNYLKWVSKNLRARHFEEWANLADNVLADPIYKDRIEWEFAQNLLSGDNVSTLGKDSVVTDLLEISTRFGWDNDDKLGWSKINFELLGSSKGGRIPRLANKMMNGTSSTDCQVEESEKESNSSSSSSSSRERRRERMRLLRIKNDFTGNSKNDSDHYDGNVSSGDVNKDQFVSETRRRFPGREGLLNKVLSRGSRKQF